MTLVQARCAGLLSGSHTSQRQIRLLPGRIAADTSTAGPKAAFGSAVGCGILLGVFEGVGVLMGRAFAQPVPALPVPEQAAAAPALA